MASDDHVSIGWIDYAGALLQFVGVYWLATLSPFAAGAFVVVAGDPLAKGMGVYDQHPLWAFLGVVMRGVTVFLLAHLAAVSAAVFVGGTRLLLIILMDIIIGRKSRDA